MVSSPFAGESHRRRTRLIVARGFGRHSPLLVANRPVGKELCAVNLVRAYLKRWGVEEAGRLVKQVFDLENLRVLSWDGLVKLTWLTMWAYGLVCQALKFSQDRDNPVFRGLSALRKTPRQ